MPDITESDRLLALRATRLLDSPPEEAFDRVTRLASKLLDAPVALVSLVDIDRQFFKSQVGLPAPFDSVRETPLTHSFCQHVVRRDDVLAIRDAASDPLVRDNLAVRDLSVVAYLGVPLRLPDGSVIGSLCAIDGRPRDWSEADIAALGDLAQMVLDQIALRTEVVRRRAAEAQQTLLISELHHRVKNTLAVVQSIVLMSLRSASSLPAFRDSISARIAALGKTHALLVDREWRSASLRDLLATELAAQNDPGRIGIEGPDLRLPAQSAVALGMCIHELMTNAAKHGALSVPSGRLDVSWTLAAEGEEAKLQLDWVESGGPAVGAPARLGFGSTLLRGMLPQQTGGRVDLDYNPAGLHATIVLPIVQVEMSALEDPLISLQP